MGPCIRGTPDRRSWTLSSPTTALADREPLLSGRSRGDVEPLLRLALELRAQGVDVRMCAPPDFAERVAEVGVPFVTTHDAPDLTWIAEAVGRVPGASTCRLEAIRAQGRRALVYRGPGLIARFVHTFAAPVRRRRPRRRAHRRWSRRRSWTSRTGHDR
jgi:hypothetical protein